MHMLNGNEMASGVPVLTVRKFHTAHVSLSNNEQKVPGSGHT